MSNVKDDCKEGLRALCDWASRVDISDIPEDVLRRAVRILGDDLSVIIGARDEPELKAYHERVLKRAGVPEATVFRGGQQRTDRLSAAVANATAADWLELDEGYRGTPCHAGLYVLPALLAHSESRKLSFGELLRALVVGYETVTRVAQTWKPKIFALQAHARYAAVGASAASALAARAGSRVMFDALNAAVTFITVGPRSQLASGSLARNAWPAAGAWSGMMSLEWAECGIIGAEDSFHDVYAGVLSADVRPELLTSGLGRKWGIMEGFTKIFACCQHLHSAVEAALDVRADVAARGGIRRIVEISVDTHPLAMPFSNRKPATTLGAKFSMPHAVATAIATGSGGADAFTNHTLADPEVSRLRECVSLNAYAPLPEAPNDRPARLRLRLEDGSTLMRECLSAQGGSDRPFQPSTYMEKMRILAAPVYPAFPAVFEDLMRIEARRLKQGWPDIVSELCGAA